MSIAGWYRDPTGHGDGRYWDGQRWGDQINRDGVTMTSPMDPAGAETPPAPGTEYVVSRVTPATAPVDIPPTPRSPLGPILIGIAVVVAVVALLIALNSGDDGNNNEETPSTTTAQPVATDPPAE